MSLALEIRREDLLHQDEADLRQPTLPSRVEEVRESPYLTVRISCQISEAPKRRCHPHLPMRTNVPLDPGDLRLLFQTSPKKPPLNIHYLFPNIDRHLHIRKKKNRNDIKNKIKEDHPTIQGDIHILPRKKPYRQGLTRDTHVASERLLAPTGSPRYLKGNDFCLQWRNSQARSSKV